MTGEVAYSTRQEPDHSVVIVVHVEGMPGEEKRAALVSAPKNHDGIVTAEFCPLRCHLMLIRYDRKTFNSQDVPGQVKNQDVHAELIGPV